MTSNPKCVEGLPCINDQVTDVARETKFLIKLYTQNIKSAHPRESGRWGRANGSPMVCEYYSDMFCSGDVHYDWLS